MDLDFAYERKDLYSRGTHHVSSLILIVLNVSEYRLVGMIDESKSSLLVLSSSHVRSWFVCPIYDNEIENWTTVPSLSLSLFSIIFK